MHVEYLFMTKTHLKQILWERDITARWLASESKISETNLNLIINGGRIPTLRVAYAIAKVLDMPVEAIWPWEEVVKEDETK